MNMFVKIEENLKPTIPPAQELYKKYKEKYSHLSGKRKPLVEKIFQKILVIYPSSLRVTNYGRERPLSAFNPGATLQGRKLYVFPRLVFDYYWYVSSIGVFTLDIEDTLKGYLPRDIPTKIILYPSRKEDLRGCEDPRIQELGSRLYILYTAVEPGLQGVNARQALAVLEDGNAKKLGSFKLNYKGDLYNTFWKDSAIISSPGGEPVLLLRPTIPLAEDANLEIGWSAPFNPDNLTVDAELMEPSLVDEAFEIKVGWSTNSLKISSNEFLVGWHGVGKDLIYRNGLALLDNQGELLAISNYLLEPSATLEEFYGDRPGVVFGCGLIRYGDIVLWIGGLSDYAIGIWSARIDEIMEKLKYIS